MPQINFKLVPELKPQFEYVFQVIPNGWHLAEILHVKPEFQPSGVERWTVMWGIVAGPHKGTAVKDWMHWGDEDDGPRSEQALARCKMVCKEIGINTDIAGPVEIKPENVIGGICYIETRQKPDKKDPTKVYVNITLCGFRAAPDADISNVHAEDAQMAMGLSQNPFPEIKDKAIPF